jgi:hypothetical protein
MRSRPLRRFNQLVDNMLRRRAIGIPHPKVNNVLTTLARRGLQLACNVEHIRRQPRQPSKLFHSRSLAPVYLPFIHDAITPWQ